ncbi:MAG: AAA family ATPase [bacterium]
MYLDFFKLKEPPFNITPDPHYLYMSRQHREAYNHVMYGIQHRKGFIQLTGEVGSGKTTLCRAVLAELGQKVQTALILNPCLTEAQLIRAILQDFGLKTAGKDMLKLIETLNTFLLGKMEAQENVALLIDEAQNLSSKLMEQIRLLSNLETTQQKLIQIVLIGQPELEVKLKDASLRQLRQRITVRYHLGPLDENEIGSYIAHRLTTAGANGRLSFDARALHLAYRYSEGIPRLINAVCDNALLAGYVAGTGNIDKSCMKRAIAQLEGRS